MREYLFRGKREDEWFYGDLITVDGDHFIFDEGDWVFVDPETVGEFTGLTDKNGTKVFEGDVVKFRDECDGELIGEVFCDQIMFDWRVYVPKRRDEYFLANSRNGKCEVIGNKWDNADLLEGKNG